MAFLDVSKSNIAYKLALGKIHTSNLRESFNEPESTLPISMGQYAWANKIHPTTPDDVSNSGVVSSVITLNLSAVSGTDGSGAPSAYYCKLGAAVPGELVGKINPRTGLAYAAFDRVGNIIPSSAGSAYRPKLFKGAVETTPMDASDWFIDCFAGVVTQETDVPANMIDYSTGGTVQVYIYIGKTVSDAISTAQAAASATTFYDKKTVGNGVTGEMDGTNKAYTLQASPDANSEHVYLNGILLRPGAEFDYTLATNVITLSDNCIPIATDNLVVSYRTTA